MSDSSDSDIFIEYQRKPINKLTVNDALRIKQQVLCESSVVYSAPYTENKDYQSSLNSNSNSATPRKRKPSSSVETPKSLSSKKIKMMCLALSNKKVTDYFSPTKKSPLVVPTTIEVKNNATKNGNTNDERDSLPMPKSATLDDGTEDTENITLSPGIKRRRNRFKQISNSQSPTSSKQNESASTQADSVKRNLFFVPPFNETSVPNDKTSFVNDPEILSMLIDMVIVLHEALKNKAFREENRSYNLFTNFDMNVFEKYRKLDLSSRTLYMKMFFRKRGWNRTSAIKYDELNEIVLFDLQSNGFIDMDIQNDDIRVQLNLLLMPEIVPLWRQFSGYLQDGSKKKESLIESLINSCKQQKSALDLFSSRRQPHAPKPESRLQRLKEAVKEKLQGCFRLEEKHAQSITRAVLLFSMFHDVESEEKRLSSQRNLLYQLIKKTITFVNYELSPSIIFQDISDFIEYEKAVNLRNELEQALESKEFTAFNEAACCARRRFAKLVKNERYCGNVKALPTFLRRYSAGSVYGYILTNFCEKFKKQTDVAIQIQILKELLEQDTFSIGSRGKWYELLCLAYRAASRIEDEARTVLTAARDGDLDEVRKLTLQLKAQQILRLKKKNRIRDSQLKDALDDFGTLMVQEPSSIEINARALSGNVQGSKIVYVSETAGGKSYSSVEETAIYHYKSNCGFSEGIHDEGHVVATIFYLLFFDIIYESNVEGVFQSSYQTRPLDFFSSQFYINRKHLIDCRLAEMKNWSMLDVAREIERIYANYNGTTCVVSWKESPRLLCDIIECLQIPAVIKICERFLHKPRIARSGFPDLIVWDRATKKCKFVEVKSPNDKLSSKQRVWMDYLKKSGIDTEVCNVKNTAGRKLKPAKSALS